MVVMRKAVAADAKHSRNSTASAAAAALLQQAVDL